MRLEMRRLLPFEGTMPQVMSSEYSSAWDFDLADPIFSLLPEKSLSSEARVCPRTLSCCQPRPRRRSSMRGPSHGLLSSRELIATPRTRPRTGGVQGQPLGNTTPFLTTSISVRLLHLGPGSLLPASRIAIQSGRTCRRHPAHRLQGVSLRQRSPQKRERSERSRHAAMHRCQERGWHRVRPPAAPSTSTSTCLRIS